MAGELERLLIRLEADTSILRKALADADKGVGAFASGTDARLSKVGKAFKGLDASIMSSMRGLAAGFGVAALAQQAFFSINAAAELNDSARSASLTAEAYQELAGAARATGTPVEEFAAASKKFAINMSQLRAETGKFNAFLQEHLPALATQLRATKSQEEAYGVLANALAGLAAEEDRTAVITKALGENGDALMDILGKGASVTAEARAEVAALGGVMSQEAVDGAEAMQKRYEEVATFLNNQFTTAVVGAADVVTKLGDRLSRMKLELPGGFEMSFGSGPETKSAASTGSTIGADRIAFAGSGFAQSRIKGAGSSLAKKGANDFGEWKTEIDFSTVDALADLKRQVAEANNEAFESIRLDYEVDLERFRRLLADKKISQDEFEAARVDLQAVSSGKISDAIKAENEQYRAHFAEIEGLISQTFMGVFSEALETGEVQAEKFFASMLRGFAELTMQALILKPIMDSLFSSPGASGAALFAPFFAPGRAAGGPVTRGQPYMVGEQGPEFFVPSASGRVMNARDTAGGGVVYNIDARGADIGVAERVERALAASRRAQSEPVSAVRGYQRRFPQR